MIRLMIRIAVLPFRAFFAMIRVALKSLRFVLRPRIGSRRRRLLL